MTPLARQLPAADLIVPPASPRPAVRAGDDARLLLLRALAYGDANAQKLGQARSAYEAVRESYSTPPD